MPRDILCRIEECQYNDQNGRCGADNIEIRSSIDNNVCSTSESTCCETFMPKNYPTLSD